MGLEDVLRSGVATVRQITSSMHVTVTHKVWLSQGQDGTPVFASVSRPCLVDSKLKLVKDWSGREVMSRTTLIFLTPIDKQIDPKDVFVLPDGAVGTVLNTSGFLDSKTTLPFAVEVFLG